MKRLIWIPLTALLASCSSVPVELMMSPPPPVASPAMPIMQSATVSTNGAIWLAWDNSETPVAITNLTTGDSVDAGYFSSYMFWGLEPGSNYSFIASNTNGSSNIATGTAGSMAQKSTIEIHSFRVTLPVKPSVVTWIWDSTNLLTWRIIESIVTTNSTHTIIWTNDGVSRFFRTSVP